MWQVDCAPSDGRAFSGDPGGLNAEFLELVAQFWIDTAGEVMTNIDSELLTIGPCFPADFLNCPRHLYQGFPITSL